MGDWRQTSQTADERLGDPPPTVHPGALSDQNGDEILPRGPPVGQCFWMSSGGALLGIFLRYAGPWNVIFCHRLFSSVCCFFFVFRQCTLYRFLCPRPLRAEALRDDACLTSVCLSVWRLSVAYNGPESRTERPRKTKIGTEVAHATRDSDTTFKVKRSKVNLQREGHIVAASGTCCFITNVLFCCIL